MGHIHLQHLYKPQNQDKLNLPNGFTFKALFKATKGDQPMGRPGLGDFKDDGNAQDIEGPRGEQF